MFLFLYYSGRNDVQLGTTFVRIFPGPPNQRQLVTFSLLVDSTAQELDETFTITFTIIISNFGSISNPTIIRNTLQGTIVDRNGTYPTSIVHMIMVGGRRDCSILVVQWNLTWSRFIKK